MSRCLYDHEDGYYMNKRPKLGREGDFYTSAYIGEGMARTLVRRFARSCSERGWDERDVYWVELGPGTGRLAYQLIKHLSLMKICPRKYVLVEKSPYHQEESMQLLAELQHEQHQMDIEWWSEEQLMENAHKAPIFAVANELLDAFPVERVRRQGSQLMQAYIEMHKGHEHLEWAWREAADEVTAFIQTHQLQLYDGQIYDAALQASRWLQSFVQGLKKAELLFVDYGGTSEELTGEHRMEGTLACYHHHRVQYDPLLAPGEQDITAHVDFDVMSRAVSACAGARVHPLVTQQQFLVEEGLLDDLVSHQLQDPFCEEARCNRAIRQLLLSDMMSERFQVMRITVDHR